MGRNTAYLQGLGGIGQTSLGDSANLDAFSRLRVSEPYTQFESTFQYAPSTFANQQQWESALSGTGAIAPVPLQSSVRLTTGGTASGASAIAQTKQHFLYQPGKSRLVLMTFACGAATTNSSFEIGYSSDNNGVLFQRISDASTTLNYITLRTKTSGVVVEDQVPQSDWNLDKMDGTGPSLHNLDFTKTQILVIDLQFLGVGRVRIGFDVDGVIHYAHQFLNANVQTVVYMESGSRPLRCRVWNTGISSGTLTADFICTSVVSEGGFDTSGQFQFAADNNITGIATSTALRPIVSIRPKALFNSTTYHGHIIPLLSSILVTSQIHEWSIIRNCTLTTGGGAATWADVNTTYSATEVCVNANNTITDGIIIASGYAAAGGSGSNAFTGSGGALAFSFNPLVLTSLNATQETLTLATRTVTSTGVAYGSITWAERY